MAELTRADIQALRFSKPGIGRRGYDEAEVDAFIDRVDQTLIVFEEREQARLLAQMVAESEAMEARTEVFAAEPPSTSSYTVIPAPESPSWGQPDPGSVVGRVLVVAQEAADRIAADAVQAAEITQSAAEVEAARVVQAAQMEAVIIVGRAQDEVAVLEDRIAKLRAFEAAYRVKVREFVEAQLAAM